MEILDNMYRASDMIQKMLQFFTRNTENGQTEKSALEYCLNNTKNSKG